MSEVEVAAVGCCTLVAIVVAGGGFGSPQRLHLYLNFIVNT